MSEPTTNLEAAPPRDASISSRHTSKPRARGRLRAWLTSIALVVVGMGIGATLMLAVGVRVVQRVMSQPERWPERTADRLRARADLTSQQHAQALAILRERFANLNRLRAEIHPRLTAEIDALESDIARLLNPEQARRWHEQVERIRLLVATPLALNQSDPKAAK